ncbi:unnamed protein product [Rotaria sp. Silwood1]|nr:unnamed protein product [Rotaria sp. Silwood1]CAF1654441.1 unnamed protein product [Rotaria sp. Silwood1]
MNNPTTITTIDRTTTSPLSPKPKGNICSTATWAQHGITIIGGTSYEGPSVDLDFPQGMFIDENQTIYIADTGNHRVIKWKQDASSVEIITDGNDKENINTCGSNKPFDVVVDKNGTIYIAYLTINQVQKWIRGADRGETMINIHSPLSIAIDNEESIYVSSMSSSKLKKYRKGVTYGQVLMSGEVGPFPLTVDRHRSVYMVDMYHDRILKIDEGKRTISVVVDGSENSGTHLLSKPHSIAVNESGALYITEWGNHRITRWLPGSTNGIVIVGDRGSGSHSNQLHNPTDLRFDSEGNLYVVDAKNGRIQKFLIDNSSYQ